MSEHPSRYPLFLDSLIFLDDPACEPVTSEHHGSTFTGGMEPNTSTPPRNAIRETLLFFSENEKAMFMLHNMLYDQPFSVVETPFEEMKIPGQKPVSVILVEMSSCPWSFEHLHRILQRDLPDVPVILLDDPDRSPEERKQMLPFVFSYRRTPCPPELLLHDLNLAVEHQRLARKNAILNSSIGIPVQDFTWCGLHSPKTLNRKRIAAFGKLGGNVLIRGEWGTGKQLTAQQIHLTGPRRDKPFVFIPCEALTPITLDAYLFGCERGGQTGLRKEYIGRLELADGGTVYFDRVEELPLSIQIKLHRFLKDRRFYRLGGHTPVSVDVQVIAGSESDLATACLAGAFWRDLYHHLSVQTITLAPLRDLVGEIPTLAQNLLNQYVSQTASSPLTILPDAMHKLQGHSWPGNLWEFQHVLSKACQLSRQGVVTARDVTFESSFCHQRKGFGLAGMTLFELERQLLIETMTANRNNREATAEQMGVSIKTVYNKLRMYNLHDKFKQEEA